jgi:excisionase family DNA binding protein
MVKILGAEQQQRALPRAMSVPEFCQRYGPGRTTTYQEIQAGRLRARKVGRRTIISQDDAEDWLRRLPAAFSSETGK